MAPSGIYEFDVLPLECMHFLPPEENCKTAQNKVFSRIQSALVSADSLNEKKGQFAVAVRSFPPTAPCLQGTLIE